RDIAYPDYQCGLVLTDTTTGLTDIPLQDPGQVVAKDRFVLKDEYSSAKMEVVTVYTGSFADDIRDRLNNTSLPDIQDQFLKFYDNYYPGIKVADSLRVQDEEASGKITMHEYYTVDNLWEEKDGVRKTYFEPQLINN